MISRRKISSVCFFLSLWKFFFFMSLFFHYSLWKQRILTSSFNFLICNFRSFFLETGNHTLSWFVSWCNSLCSHCFWSQHGRGPKSYQNFGWQLPGKGYCISSWGMLFHTQNEIDATYMTYFFDKCNKYDRSSPLLF